LQTTGGGKAKKTTGNRFNPRVAIKVGKGPKQKNIGKKPVPPVTGGGGKGIKLTTADQGGPFMVGW